MAGGAGVVSGKVGRVEAESHPLAIEDPARLRAVLTVNQAELATGYLIEPGCRTGQLRPGYEAFPPGGEPHDFGAARQFLRGGGVVPAPGVAQVHAGGVDQAG